MSLTPVRLMHRSSRGRGTLDSPIKLSSPSPSPPSSPTPKPWRRIERGISLRVKATPNARVDGINGIVQLADTTALGVHVKAAPVDGAANAALVGVIAKMLNTHKSAVKVISSTGRIKRVDVVGEVDEIISRLEAVCATKLPSSSPSSSGSGPSRGLHTSSIHPFFTSSTVDDAFSKLSLEGKMYRIVPSSMASLPTPIPNAPTSSTNTRAPLVKIIPQRPASTVSTSTSFRPGPTTPPRIGDLARFMSTSTSSSTAPHKAKPLFMDWEIDEIIAKSPLTVEKKAISVEKATVVQRRVVQTRLPGVVSQETYKPTTLAQSQSMTATAHVAVVAEEPLAMFTHHEHGVNVVYTTSSSEADDLIACLRGDVLGLDLEWPPPGVGPVYTKTRRDGTTSQVRKGAYDPVLRRMTWPQGRTAVIQISDGKTAVVFHMLGNSTPGPRLVALLADSTRLKVGVAVSADARKLMRDFKECAAHPPAGLLELSSLAKAIEPARWKDKKRLVALQLLSRAYLHKDLDKGDVRLSAWDKSLNGDQIDYAVNDVVVSFLLHDALLRRAGEVGVDVNVAALATSLP